MAGSGAKVLCGKRVMQKGVILKDVHSVYIQTLNKNYLEENSTGYLFK